VKSPISGSGAARFLFLAIAIAWSAAAQGDDPGDRNEFSPPIGRKPLGLGIVPGDRRLLMAVSADGINFARTNTIITDQADSPNLVASGTTLWLYYRAAKIDNDNYPIAVAVSSDAGKHWSFKRIRLDGVPAKTRTSPAAVHLLADGTFRMVFNDAYSGALLNAESSDGVHFTKQELAFQLPGQTFLRWFSARIDDTWHMYIQGYNDGQSWHATSTDGRSFVNRGRPDLSFQGLFYRPDCAVLAGDGLRIFGTSISSASISSFVTRDGNVFVQDKGYRLTLDPSNPLESEFLREPTVARLADGTYLMVYVSRIPE
jgi:hypothetical protein